MAFCFWKKKQKWTPFVVTEIELMPICIDASQNDKYTTFELFPDGTEVCDQFLPIAFETMNQILEDFQVLTFIHSFCMGYPRKVKNKLFVESFPEDYYHFLEIHGMADRVYYQELTDVVTKTKGMNEAAAKLVFLYARDLCTYEAYGFSEPLSISGVLEARSCVEQGGYSVFVEFERYPDTLRMRINTDKISVEKLIEAARSACEMHGMKLKIDPKVLM